MTSLAFLALAPALVDYECLARPLPEVLQDLSRSVGKRLACDEVLTEDRVVVRVTQVEPRVLIEKIAKAVAGRIEETPGSIVLRPDHEFETRILKLRQDRIADMLKREGGGFDQPIRIRGQQQSIVSLRSFVTPALLGTVGLSEIVTFARPPMRGERALPANVLRFSVGPENGSAYTGPVVRISSTPQSLNVNVVLRYENGMEMPVYNKGFTYMTEPAAMRQAVQLSELLTRRVSAIGMIGRRTERQVVLTDALDAFKGRPWGDEPLNALVGPVIVEAAKHLDRDVVACLPDAAMESVGITQRPTLRAFLTGNLSEEDGQWIVSSPGDPRSMRENRVNRVQLREYLESVTSRGWFEFWAHARYLQNQRTLGRAAMRFEAAAIGPVAVATLNSFDGEANAGLYLALRSYPDLWPQGTERKSVAISSLPLAVRTALDDAIRSRNRVRVQTITTEGGRGRTSTTVTETSRRTSELGLERGLPASATVSIAKSGETSLFCLHEVRRYMSVTTLMDYANAIAYSEAGRGDETMHALYQADCLIPAQVNYYHLQISLNGSTSLSDVGTVRFIDLPFGSEKRTRETLPGIYKSAFEAHLSEARRRAGL